MRQPFLKAALAIASLTAATSTTLAQTHIRHAGEQVESRVERVVYGNLPAYSAPRQCADCGGAACYCESKGGDKTVGSGVGDGNGLNIAPDTDELAQSGDFGDPMGAYSASPGVIGDYFGGGLTFEILGASFSAPVAAGDRIFKIVENMNPIPTDRVFFNYHLFNRPLTSADGREVDLNRFIFGCERTVMNGRISFELRIPFASGLDATQDINPGVPEQNDGTEFGNIAFAIKALLVNNGYLTVSSGLGLSTPTGRDSTILDDGSLIGTFENEAFHLQPFVAFLLRPSERSWIQIVSQASFSANGNSVFLASSGATGVVQDQSLLFLTASFGTWLYRNDGGNAMVRGIAPIFELHYSTTMQDTDVFYDPGSGKRISNLANRLDVLNATGGIRVQLGARTFVTASAVAPLRDDGDKLFDSEFSLQVVRMR